MMMAAKITLVMVELEVCEFMVMKMICSKVVLEDWREWRCKIR